MTSPQPAESRLLSTGEVAQAFGVDPKTVTRWAADGRLTTARTLGGHRRFFLSEVQQFLDSTFEGDAPTRPPITIVI